MKYITKCLPALIVTVGCILTCVAAWIINDQVERNAVNAFNKRADYLQDAVSDRLRSYEDVLFAVAGFYQTNPSVSALQFREYVASLDLARRSPAIGNVNYAQQVSSSAREQFIQSFSTEYEGITLRALESSQNENMILTRSWPDALQSIGTDLYRSPSRVSNHKISVTSASFRPHASFSSGMPIRPPGIDRVALAARLGVFDLSDPASPRLTGTVGIGINLKTFFNEVVRSESVSQVHYRLETVGRVGMPPYKEEVAVFSSEMIHGVQQRTDGGQRYTTSYLIPFGGALLRLEISEARSQYVGAINTMLPYAVMAAGALLFSLAALLVRQVLERNATLESAVARRTADLDKEVRRGKQLERELVTASERERRRVGYELHDDLGQKLTSLSLSSKALEEALERVAPELSPTAAAIVEETHAAIVGARGLAHSLMAVPPGRRGLRDALRQLAINVSSSRHLKCTFDFDDPVDIDNNEVSTNLYRIAQEAVNNAVKHSGATAIQIQLSKENNKVKLDIADNGHGFRKRELGDTNNVQHDGAGMQIMAYRAATIGYQLAVQSTNEGGTTITVQEI